MRDRHIVTIAAIAALGLIWRMFSLQVIDSRNLKVKAIEQRLQPDRLDAPRGEMVDRTGQVLATTRPAVSVYAMPKEIQDLDRVVKVLAPALNMDPVKLRELMARDVSFVWLAKRVSPDVAAAVEKLDEPAIKAVKEYQRYYPQGSLAKPILGFVGSDNQGLAGVELMYNADLTGSLGRSLAERSGVGGAIPQSYRRDEVATPGAMMVLTLDARVQAFAEETLNKFAKDYNAKRAGVVLMETATGRILTMASYSTDKRDYDNGYLKNLITGYVYEPGSTMKPITVASGMDAGVVNESMLFGGVSNIKVDGGPPIWTWTRGTFPPEALRDCLINSDNVCLTQIGQALGRERFYQYVDRFKLNERVGSDIGGEDTGWYVPLQDIMSDHQFAGMSFGQNMTTTPMQLLQAWNAIPNKGKIVKPHVVDRLLDERGDVLREIAPKIVAEPIRADVADKVRDYLVTTAQENVPLPKSSYPMGGKTGTAQKAEDGCYQRTDCYVVSWAAFAPAMDPKVTGLVFVDNPTKEGEPIYGSNMAAPVLRDVINFALPLLNVVTERTEVHVQSDYTGLPLVYADADARALGWTVKVEGNGPAVVSQKVEKDSKGKLTLYLTSGEFGQTAPYLTGMKAGDVPLAWKDKITFKGSGPTIVGQETPPGQPWPGSLVVHLGEQDPRLDMVASHVTAQVPPRRQKP